MADRVEGTRGPGADKLQPSPEATENAGNRGHLGTFESLRIRNFRLLLIGTTLSNAAQWIQQVTLGWLVFDITGSGAMLGTVNLVRSLATLTFTPLSGVAIDRVERRRLAIAVNTWLLLISLVLGFVLISGEREVWHLFVFMFLGGIAQTFDVPLRQTLVFMLVPRNYAPNALALVQTGWGLMRSFGPATGGFLILWFGPGGNFLVQAGAYGLIALNILRIEFPTQAPLEGNVSFLRNLRDGFGHVMRDRTTRTFLVMGWVLPLFIIPNFTALTPIYAKEKFEGGPEVLGILMAAVGTGGIFGGLVTASLGRVEYRGRVQLAALFLLSLSLIAFAFSPNLAAGWTCFALAGFFEMIFLTSNQTLLQLSIPDELRGRVTSITTLSMGLSTIGGLYAGAGSDLVGPETVTVILACIAAVVAVGSFVAVPVIRNYRISTTMQSAVIEA